MKLQENKVYHIDNLEGMKLITSKSVNLIISDPPYFEIKGDFDFVFKGFDDYLEFMEAQAKEYKRILADNGTLFVYGHAKRIAYVQVIFDKYFNLENNIAIEFNRQTKKGVYDFRCFAPVSERLLMYSNEIEMTGLEMIKLDVQNFKPLRDYFEYLQKSLNVPKKAFLDKIGQNADHCFRWGSTQWDLPTEQTYDQLIEMFRIDLLEGFKTYEELRQTYEELRRPFNNFMGLFDIMSFNQEAHITRHYDHDTVKPETLTRALILTCSRANDLVVVPFAGSGTECAMAAKEGRRFIGFDIEKKYVDMSNKRVDLIMSQPNLF
jgi:site-specific DNA-methyltransferase (adenine-specific)